MRAEAAAVDPYVALDKATTKLLERLRRAHSRKVERRGEASSRWPRPPPGWPPPLPELGEPQTNGTADGASSSLDDSPIEIREKVHAAPPMTLEQALYEMELVGHDFFLFCDADTGQPSVVYRRRGWEYGVLHLDVEQNGAVPPQSADAQPLRAEVGS